MRTLVLELEHLPDSRLSKNSRIHWAVERRVFGEAKDELVWLAKTKWAGLNTTDWSRFSPMGRARISYEFHMSTLRARDFDNLITSCKPYPDALVEAGVIAHDDIWHLEYGSIRAVHDERWEGTVIRVEEV